MTIPFSSLLTKLFLAIESSGQGNDISLGGNGGDTLKAGQGDDVLNGGIDSEADKFKCGSGEDTVINYDPTDGDKITGNC
jgi:Ca2+-binding RTX toxin-like protein